MLSLLDVCSFCFEKNETLNGWGQRVVPSPTEELAMQLFAGLAAEAQRLFGAPPDVDASIPRANANWPRLRMSVSGRLVQVLVLAPPYDDIAPPDTMWRAIRDEEWAGVFEDHDRAPEPA